MEKFVGYHSLKSNFHSELNVKKASMITRNYLQTIFDQQFHKDLFIDMRSNDEGNKLRIYRTFKDKITQEHYLTCIKKQKN